MNKVVEHITLDASKQGCQVTLAAKKGDTQTREIRANIISRGKAFYAAGSCVINAKKPDGTVVYADCTVENGTIKCVIPSSMFAAAGRVECELMVYDESSNQLTSPRFEYVVEDVLYDEAAVISTDDYTALVSALATANKFGSVSASASTLAAGAAATAEAEIGVTGVTFEFGIPQGIQGQTGNTGRGITGIAKTSGTGAAGTTDTYTIEYSDGTTSTFTVYNGADGDGSGDMLKSIYDPTNKNTDIYAYADQAEADAKTASRPATWMPTAAQVGARPSDWMPTAAQVGAAASDHTHTAAQVGAYPIYKSLAEIGCTTANTLKEVYTALPQGSVLILDWCGKSVSAYSGTTFGNALPANYGPLYLYKPGGTNGVGKFEFWAYSSSETSIPYVKFVTNANGNWSETEWLMDTPLRSGDSVTMGSGFTNNGMEIYKLGPIVVFTMRGKWTGSATDINGRTICTLPAGYRPYGDTDSGIFRVTSAGECKCVQTASVAANATFSTCFVYYAHG